MIKLGLIGHPVGHSLSPKIQSAALKASGLNGEYSLFPVAPDDLQALKDLIEKVRSGWITGFNVTIPHKQNVIPLLDELTPAARAIGAVNIIYRRGDKLIGDNTDASGFSADLKRSFGTQARPRDAGAENGRSNALVLGAGGSARSVVYALCQDGWQVTVAARRIGQAQQLAGSLTGQHLPITVLDFSLLETHLKSLSSRLSLLVNTTPIGMTPDIGKSPLPENTPLPAQTKIYDLVYNPGETKLVRDARAQGLQAVTGLGMLVEQAALGFTLWTGIELPVEVFRNAVE